jgi:hypothetical protein
LFIVYKANMPRKHIQITLDQQLAARAKVLAHQHLISLSELIARLLTAEAEKVDRSTRRRAVLNS